MIFKENGDIVEKNIEEMSWDELMEINPTTLTDEELDTYFIRLDAVTFPKY